MNKNLIFPNIDTKRLELREITVADRDDIYEIFSDEEVVKYYDLEPFADRHKSIRLIELFTKRYENSSGIRWGIYPKNHNKCVGTCGFNNWVIPMRSATIGYDLNREYWGRGLMAEALHSTLSLAFSGGLVCGELNRIQADTVPGNLASERVLLKLGFKQEGIRRQSGFWKGKYHDLKCFGLLKEDFNNEN